MDREHKREQGRNGNAVMTVAEATEPGGPLDRLLKETIIPNLERLARVQMAGDIAVVVHTTPCALGLQSLEALGWSGRRVFPLNRTRARRWLSPCDPVTARWVERRDPNELRMFIVWGSGTLLVNFRSGEGYSIEPGSLDADLPQAFGVDKDYLFGGRATVGET